MTKNKNVDANIANGCEGCPKYDDCEIRIEAEEMGLDPDHGIAKDFGDAILTALKGGLGDILMGALFDGGSKELEKFKVMVEVDHIFDVVKMLMEGSDKRVSWYANTLVGMREKRREAIEDHEFTDEQNARIFGFTDPTIEYAEAVVRLGRDYARKMVEYLSGLPHIEEIGEMSVDEDTYTEILGED
jgi:hypothetical protein